MSYKLSENRNIYNNNIQDAIHELFFKFVGNNQRQTCWFHRCSKRDHQHPLWTQTNKKSYRCR